MLKFMLCCQGDPNCPRFPAPECNQTLCASVVLTFASLDSHRHHLGSSTGPRSFSPSAISLLLPAPPTISNSNLVSGQLFCCALHTLFKIVWSLVKVSRQQSSGTCEVVLVCARQYHLLPVHSDCDHFFSILRAKLLSLLSPTNACSAYFNLMMIAGAVLARRLYKPCHLDSQGYALG